jgi:hypothetical protein
MSNSFNISLAVAAVVVALLAAPEQPQAATKIVAEGRSRRNRPQGNR